MRVLELPGEYMEHAAESHLFSYDAFGTSGVG